LDFLRWKNAGNSLDSIDGFIAVSNALWDIFLKHMPELKDKYHAIIYNPIIWPLKYVKPDPDEPYGDYILYASGSDPVKGPHILLNAWSIVSREFKDLKLYMVRCKDTWVERYAKRLGLTNVVFTDRLPPSNYYNIMYRARAVVTPSIWPEPLSRIPTEANRLGVPAVVSSSGGLPETIVDNVTGYVFRTGDVEDLAEKIAKTITANFERNTIIQHSYEKINPQKEVEKFIKFLENVTKHSKT
jgi:glycosyltransferase involved in cell wall biosynthesis